MTKNEHNIPEIEAWIKRIIDSCENTFHFEGAQVLINKFKKICKKESDWIEVQDYFNVKYNKVHGIINNLSN
jgi:hypothetical protein